MSRRSFSITVNTVWIPLVASCSSSVTEHYSSYLAKGYFSRIPNNEIFQIVFQQDKRYEHIKHSGSSDRLSSKRMLGANVCYHCV